MKVILFIDPKLDCRPVREFGSWTAALRETADWLKGLGIKRVVLQSTGVYWIPLQDVLERAGLEVAVVDARGTKNLPGRKSDVQECQWIRKLDIYGLLRDCFQLPASMRAIPDAVAPAAALGDGGGPDHSTNAESLDCDECAVGQHPQRYHRQDGIGDHAGDGGRRTQSLEAGGPA
jgi:hypothetical protein